jgi:hypothetical protein
MVWCQGGGERLRELSHVLHSDLIIRRLKKDVLSQLPPFRRQIVNLERPSSDAFAEAEELAWQVHHSLLMLHCLAPNVLHASPLLPLYLATSSQWDGTSRTLKMVTTGNILQYKECPANSVQGEVATEDRCYGSRLSLASSGVVPCKQYPQSLRFRALLVMKHRCQTHHMWPFLAVCQMCIVVLAAPPACYCRVDNKRQQHGCAAWNVCASCNGAQQITRCTAFAEVGRKKARWAWWGR